MPIYEFQCQHCGGRIEELMRLSDPDPVACPSCGQPGLKRMLSAPSFRLAGSGWYETDFKKDGKRNLAGDGGDSKPDARTDAKSDAKPESKSDSKSDSKPESRPEAKAASPAPAPTNSSKASDSPSS